MRPTVIPILDAISANPTSEDLPLLNQAPMEGNMNSPSLVCGTSNLAGHVTRSFPKSSRYKDRQMLKHMVQRQVIRESLEVVKTIRQWQANPFDAVHHYCTSPCYLGC